MLKVAKKKVFLIWNHHCEPFHIFNYIKEFKSDNLNCRAKKFSNFMIKINFKYVRKITSILPFY